MFERPLGKDRATFGTVALRRYAESKPRDENPSLRSCASVGHAILSLRASEGLGQGLTRGAGEQAEEPVLQPLRCQPRR